MIAPLFSDLSVVQQAAIGGFLLSCANAFGAIWLLGWRKPKKSLLDGALGFSAGLMLTASFTSLALPAIEAAGITPVAGGMLLGTLVLGGADRWIPHIHSAMGREGIPTGLHAAWLFVFAIAIHNIPEGLAVGTAFGLDDLANAVTLLIAVSLQDIPEGLAAAVAAFSLGITSRQKACLLGIAVGLLEWPTALIGASLAEFSHRFVPYAMGFAAGAMLFIITSEVIPEAHSRGHKRVASSGLMIGIVVMLYLDLWLAS